MANKVSDADFEEEVLKGDLPVLVDFYADWCGPCKMIAPLLEELSADNAGKAKVVKLDIDSNQQTAAAYSVQSIPTLIVFKSGVAVDRIVGAQSKAKLQELIDKHI